VQLPVLAPSFPLVVSPRSESALKDDDQDEHLWASLAMTSRVGRQHYAESDEKGSPRLASPYDDSATEVIDIHRDGDLQRGLKARQISMIAVRLLYMFFHLPYSNLIARIPF
jgi:hypothetical protein